MRDTPPAELLLAEAQRLTAIGDHAGAQRQLVACVQRHPDFAPGFGALAALLRAGGAAGPAMEALSRGLARTGDPALAAALAPALASLGAVAPHPVLERDLLACLTAPGVDPQALARVAGRLLATKYRGRPLDGGDPLLAALLVRCINVDAELEAQLVAARRAALMDGQATPLAEALAMQAFANEYVWPVAADEAALAARAAPPLAALYRRPEAAHGLGAAFARRAVADPAEERRLAAATPGFGAPADDAVRDQYEANPYPRWTVAPKPTPVDLGAAIARLTGRPARGGAGARIETLIAGCGTGYEAIDLARTDPALRITAIDLSRASLGYAQRMAAAAGIEGIDFRAGDLLAVAALGRRFDLVVSTGVLHHLADPAAGLAALAGVLAPGGAMRIALYSRRARALVRAGRAMIARRNWPPTIDGIRAFRAAVLALPGDDPLARLAESDDFWSASGCRDLAFHVREHCYDLPEIGRMAAAAGLRIVAVDAPPAVRAAYGAGDGLDLARWDRVEAAMPAAFAGMFPLWLAPAPGR